MSPEDKILEAVAAQLTPDYDSPFEEDYDEWLALASPYDIAAVQEEILHEESRNDWGV